MAKDDLTTVFEGYYDDLATVARLVRSDVDADPRPGVDLLRKLAMETARLIVAEQFFLLPALQDAVPDGGEIVRREAGRLAGLASGMRALERVELTDPTFRGGLQDFARAVTELGDSRRSTVLPALRAALDEETLSQLGAAVTPTAEPGATHSHPAEADLYDSTWPQPGFLDAMISVFTREVQARHPSLVPARV